MISKFEKKRNMYQNLQVFSELPNQIK